MGLRLQQQRELLPNTESTNRRRAARLKTIEEAQNGFLDLTERIDVWADEEGVANEFAPLLTPPGNPRQLLEDREWTSALQHAVDDAAYSGSIVTRRPA